MASWLRLVTSNLVTRSLVPSRLTVVSSASRFLSIVAGHRRYTTMLKDDFCDQSWVKNLCPKISSMSFGMNMSNNQTSLSLFPGDGYISVDYAYPPRVVELERRDMRAYAEHNTFLLQGKTLKEIKDEMLKVTLPNEENFKTNIMANIMLNIIASFRDITAKRSWLYYDMFFDRSILGEVLCPLIAMLSPINSFSLYKKETIEQLCIEIQMPGVEKMMLTTHGLRVSLDMCNKNREGDNMREPVIEDVKTFFDYNTFFIEGKTEKEHYITCIHLPEGLHKKHNMIKRRMKNGVFHAFFPYVKNEEIKIN